MRVLSEILVISLEQAVAAPHATARLAGVGAGAGARVISVDRPTGPVEMLARGVLFGGDVAGDEEAGQVLALCQHGAARRGESGVIIEMRQE